LGGGTACAGCRGSRSFAIWTGRCAVGKNTIDKTGFLIADKPKQEKGWQAHAAAAMKMRNRMARLKTAQAPHSDRALIEAFIRERGITKVAMGASGPPSGRDEVIEEL
ncbi:MAG TPA: hypothetical protein VFD73_03245, partial [Gemmatimonadales bacterium]|nr:hypothetical protein [Gemmatimonadales bacterium]